MVTGGRHLKHSVDLQYYLSSRTETDINIQEELTRIGDVERKGRQMQVRRKQISINTCACLHTLRHHGITARSALTARDSSQDVPHHSPD